MKALAVFLALAAAPAAHADVSDSGNLTIGGNGVIAGSMTVEGAQGLGVVYGLTASSIAAGSGSFTSTVTIGPSVYTTTANYSAILNNSPSLVISTNVIGASAITLTNILSSMTYTLYLEGIKNTSAGDLGVRFNNDAGNSYGHVAHCDNAVTANAPASTSDSAIYTDETNNQIAANGVFGLTFDFRSQRKDARKMLGYFRFRADGVAGTLSHCEGTGTYHGSSAVSSLVIVTNGGTFDASLLLYAHPVQPGSSQ